MKPYRTALPDSSSSFTTHSPSVLTHLSRTVVCKTRKTASPLYYIIPKRFIGESKPGLEMGTEREGAGVQKGPSGRRGCKVEVRALSPGGWLACTGYRRAHCWAVTTKGEVSGEGNGIVFSLEIRGTQCSLESLETIRPLSVLGSFMTYIQWSAGEYWTSSSLGGKKALLGSVCQFPWCD